MSVTYLSARLGVVKRVQTENFDEVNLRDAVIIGLMLHEFMIEEILKLKKSDVVKTENNTLNIKGVEITDTRLINDIMNSLNEKTYHIVRGNSDKCTISSVALVDNDLLIRPLEDWERMSKYYEYRFKNSEDEDKYIDSLED